MELGRTVTQQVHHEHQDEVLRPVRRRANFHHRRGESLLEPQPLEERLEDHEPRERAEPLVFKPKLRDRVDGRDDLWSAQPHGSGPLRVVVGVFTTSFYTTKRPYLYASYRRELAERAVLDPRAFRRAARNTVRVTQLAGEVSYYVAEATDTAEHKMAIGSDVWRDIDGTASCPRGLANRLLWMLVSLRIPPNKEDNAR